jgi:hypothetical protein
LAQVSSLKRRQVILYYWNIKFNTFKANLCSNIIQLKHLKYHTSIHDRLEQGLMHVLEIIFFQLKLRTSRVQLETIPGSHVFECTRYAGTTVLNPMTFIANYNVWSRSNQGFKQI